MNSTLTISQARSDLPKLIEQVNQYLQRVTITVHGQPKAAVISFDELEALEETAEILNIPGASKSISTGLRHAAKNQGILLSQLK